MKVESGTTNKYVYFYAVDATDFTTPETGLTATSPTFRVYRSRNGAAAAAMTTPTINETDPTNMPGVYELLLDEDTTIDSANVSEEMVLHISHASMAPVVRTIELYRPLSRTATDNLEDMFDGTGYTADTAPASRQQVGLLSTGSASISQVAESFTKAGAEPETNTYTATQQLDGAYHIVEDDTGSTDVYYQFDVGGDGVPTEFVWEGYAQSNGDSYAVYALNWTTSPYSWEQIGTISGANGTTPTVETFQTTVSHVGIGADIGKVRMRFASSDGTAIATDRLLCSYAVVARSVGYADGAIWLDTNNGTSGTEVYVNGTADNPVLTLANALSISSSLGLQRLSCANGTSFTLSASLDNWMVYGHEWTIALGGQSVAGTMFIDANVTGVGTGSLSEWEDCIFGATTLPPFKAYRCGFGESSGTLTLASAGAYRLIDCFSDVAGSGSPVIDCTAGGGNITLELRRWSGGVTLNGLKSGDVVTVGGSDMGTVTLNGADAAVEVRGIAKAVTNNLTGSPTVTFSGVEGTDVAEILVDTGTTLPGILGTPAADVSADIAAVKSDTAAILTDTGTTLPATLTTIEGKVDTVDGVADAILVDTGTTIPAQISALSIPTATQNADALLNRDMSAVTVTNSRSPINALRFLRNKWSVSGTTLTVTAEDDSTSAWSATLTTDAAADPITGSDPS